MSRTPSFIAGASARPRRSGEWLAAALLGLALLAQLGWLQRERLAASPALRPLLVRFAPWFEALQVAREDDWVRVDGVRNGTPVQA